PPRPARPTRFPYTTLFRSEQHFEVSGVGYAPQGACNLGGQPVDPEQYPPLALAIRSGVLCNDARLHEENGQWHIDGDPTEGALLDRKSTCLNSSHVKISYA